MGLKDPMEVSTNSGEDQETLIGQAAFMEVPFRSQ